MESNVFQLDAYRIDREGWRNKPNAEHNHIKAAEQMRVTLRDVNHVNTH